MSRWKNALASGLKVIATASGLLAVALIFTFALPFIGAISATSTAESLGCDLSKVVDGSSYFYGADICARLKHMISFGGILLTPLYFLMAFGVDVLILVALAFLSAHISTRLRADG